MVISDGQAVFSEAIDLMTSAARIALAKTPFSPDDVSRFVPHQANQRLMDKVSQRLRIPHGRTLSTIATYGNSSSATIPFTLSNDAAQRPLQNGELILMTAAGAGLTGGAVVWRV